MRQLSHYVRLERDKGNAKRWVRMVCTHEAVAEASGASLRSCRTRWQGSRRSSRLCQGLVTPLWLRARDLTAVVQGAGEQAVLPSDSARLPFGFRSDWLKYVARGWRAEPLLSLRIKKVWKTHVVLSDEHARRYAAATVKSNYKQLEGGAGLRVAIVPSAVDLRPGAATVGSTICGWPCCQSRTASWAVQ